MRFEDIYGRWTESRLTQAEAAELLGVCERQFRRQCRRYEGEGLDGLIDQRLGQLSWRQAPVDEVLALSEQYRGRYAGWTVKHFYTRYEAAGGARSYNFVRLALQRSGAVNKAPRRGAHRRRRERKPLFGMMLHQDGSRHQWLAGQQHDLIVTLDDATGMILSAFLVAEEGTMSSFVGVREVILRHGLFHAYPISCQDVARAFRVAGWTPAASRPVFPSFSESSPTMAHAPATSNRCAGRRASPAPSAVGRASRTASRAGRACCVAGAVRQISH